MSGVMQRTLAILERLAAGAKVAPISDAGTTVETPSSSATPCASAARRPGSVRCGPACRSGGVGGGCASMANPAAWGGGVGRCVAL